MDNKIATQGNITPQQVQRFMRGMGKTADEVADFMRRHGVKGERYTCKSCPVAQALRQFLGEAAVVGSLAFTLVGSTSQAPIPETIRAFIEAFDRNKYPDLVL